MKKLVTYRTRFLSVILSLLMILSVVSIPAFKAKAAGGVDGFVERCYTVTLDRGSDPDGFAAWKDMLLNGRSVGIFIAYGFMFSDEYVAKNKDNRAFVKDLYTLFLDREPDEDGYNLWVGLLESGKSREEIFAGFADSTEFYGICDSYGITAGFYDARYDIFQQNNVNLFVERMYQTCLGRRGDMDGHILWVSKLLNKELTGVECAKNFIKSDEYVNKNLSNDEYVENLYKAFMGRSSDAEGKSLWLNALETGAMTRDEVFAGFANSKEFGDICASYNIVKGTYSPTDTANNTNNNNNNNNNNTNTDSGNLGDYSEDEIVDFTMFIAMPGSELSADNDIQEIIAKKTGVRVKESWLANWTVEAAVNMMINEDKYPDFIDAGDYSDDLYREGVLVAWDPYLEKYPNLKNMYSDAEWDQFRMSDGKIYWANVFNNTYGESKETTHNDEAFWIQVRVLEWAGYPEIKTIDEYFDLLEKYYDANKTFKDKKGNTVNIIPYTILCEDWRYYCLENAPLFLDGNPNNGAVAVDPKTMKVVDYNVTPTAKAYFKKLNEEYAKGIVDKDFASQTYDEYIAKLSTGAVLGMVDQTWDFNYTVQPAFEKSGLVDLGCEYVPLGITAPGVTENRYHTYEDTLNNSSGCAVTKSCKNPDKAFEFMNNLLSQEIHDLRFWGVEGVDYLVDENGLYYKTPQMRKNFSEASYNASHLCAYSFMPQWLGTSRDGKNAMQCQQQPSEYLATLSDPLAKCFRAYGAGGYADMLGSVKEDTAKKYPWYPLWSFSNAMNGSTAGGKALSKMTETKHEWLPKVIMSSNFDNEWNSYISAYNQCRPEDFLNEMQAEVDRRISGAR